jgi:hypothetical protein
MLTKGVVLHDNSLPHTASCTNALIKCFNCEIFNQPPYRPDLAPNNYHLTSKMKVWLATQHFHSNEELMDGVTTRTSQLTGAALIVYKFPQQLLLHYAAKCTRFGVQREQTLLVTTVLVLWHHANVFFFTNQSEVDFGIAYVF